MLIIRDAQMQSLGIATLKALEPDAVAHLRRRWPEKVGPWRDDALLAHVRDGMGRAWACGLGTRGSVFQYLDLMTEHGAGFETREPFEWAHAILTDADVPDPDERMGRLQAERSVREERAARSEQVRREFKNAGR